MNTYTNLAWPEDPYGTGQLWRTKPQLAASFSALFVDDGERAVPIAYAVVYLPLHRTKPMDATDGLRFGFRAATAITAAALPHLLTSFEHDTSRARRLARIVAGHQFADALHAIVAISPDAEACRGTSALALSWANGEKGSGTAELREATVSGEDLLEAAAAAGISSGSVQRAHEPQQTFDLLLAKANPPAMPGLASAGEAQETSAEVQRQTSEWFGACAAESALVIGLTTLRHLGRYRWDEALDVGEAIAANIGDCFPTQAFGAAFAALPAAQPVR